MTHSPLARAVEKIKISSRKSNKGQFNKEQPPARYIDRIRISSTKSNKKEAKQKDIKARRDKKKTREKEKLAIKGSTNEFVQKFKKEKNSQKAKTAEKDTLGETKLLKLLRR